MTIKREPSAMNLANMPGPSSQPAGVSIIYGVSHSVRSNYQNLAKYKVSIIPRRLHDRTDISSDSRRLLRTFWFSSFIFQPYLQEGPEKTQSDLVKIFLFSQNVAPVRLCGWLVSGV